MFTRFTYMFSRVLSPLRRLLLILSLWIGFATYASAASDDLNLPTLGDHTSGIVSLEQERALGQNFLRSIRAQAPLISDPLLQEYLELLIYRLASHSQLQDRRLELVIINNKTINAFAAPGGIVGVNLGLFLFGETESEISAILAHELAHLSQRHYARGTEAGKKSSLATIAGFLAGVVLMATSNAEAGMAAISASQGVAQNSMLSYSRTREQEADRVGIDTLVEADMDPRAMAYMFERLNKANRFSAHNIPEFLLTHPVTRDRIADSYSQTNRFPKEVFPPNLDFHLMRARVRVMVSDNYAETALLMEEQSKSDDPVIAMAGKYGLALCQMQLRQMDFSLRTIRELQAADPGKIAFKLAEAELHLAAQRFDSAEQVLASALKTTPNNYPLSMAYAEALMKNRHPGDAARVLEAMTVNRPTDKDVWYLLAEAYGLDNDIVGVHQARAEYFVLVGNFEQAIKQLGFATPLVKDNFQLSARIQQRIEEIWELRNESRAG